MTISIVICTLDKADKLDALLGALTRLVNEDEEVVVVDNGSKDSTESVCRIWQERFEVIHRRMRYVIESSTGLSRARNTGMRAAEGKYLLFLDDDCLPRETMLQGYRDALRAHPACVLAGGPIEPLWENEGPPLWLSPKFFWVFGRIAYDGDASRLLGKVETINGGNFLVAKDMLEQIGGFNPELGHQGDAVRGSEEQEMLARLQRATERMMLAVPHAQVWHDFPRDRLNRTYVRQRVEGASRDRALAERLSSRYLSMLARSGYYVFMLMISKDEIARAQYRGYISGVLSAMQPGRDK